MNTRSFLIPTAILLFGVLVTIGLVSQSTSDTKTDSSKAAEGATGLGAKSIKLARATQSQPPTVDVEKSDLQLAAGEEVESSEIREIRQALSELLALEEGVGSNQQIQEKKAALKAAVERGIKKHPKSVLQLLFGFTQMSDNSVGGPSTTDEVRSFIQRDPELAIALLDKVPNEFGRRILVESIGSAWAESDLKAALAWANQQTESKIKNAILEGVISSWAKTDLQGAFAYAQSLPPGDSQDSTISKVFENAAQGDQGALAMMQSLPKGRTKDLAAKGISEFMSEDDPKAAFDIASGIGDLDLRTRAEEKALFQLNFWSRENPAAATQWMQSLPVGDTKDMLSESISRPMAKNYPQAAMDIATGIGDSDLRTTAQVDVVEQWSEKDPAAATQWMQSLPEGRTKDLAASAISQSMAKNDPKAAMDMATGIGDSKLRTEAQEKVVGQWSEKNPAAATQWMQSLPEGKTKDIAASNISQSMAKNDPQAAMDMATGIGDSKLRTEAEANAARFFYEKDPAAAIQWMQSLPVGQTKDSVALGISYMSIWDKNPQAAAAMDMASGIGDTGIRTRAETEVARAWMSHDPDAAIQWMQSLPVGQTKDSALQGFIYHYQNNNNPQAACDMASGIGDTGKRTEAELDAARWFFDKDPAAAIPWMQSLPVGQTRDSAASGISRGMARNDPQAAMDMASGIGDSNLRTEAQKNVVEQWSKKDPAAATQWIKSSALPQEVKTQLLQR